MRNLVQKYAVWSYVLIKGNDIFANNYNTLIMRTIHVTKNLLVFAFMMIAISVSAQGNSTKAATAVVEQKEYKAGNEGWHIYLEEAYAESKKTGKPILANFTGKKWCGWCKRLTKDVFVHEEFKTWAADNVVLLELDYPRRVDDRPADIQKQNSELQQAFQIRGYPTIWVFDLEKDDAGEYTIAALGKTGYTKTVPEFTSGIEKMIAKRANTKGTTP